MVQHKWHFIGVLTSLFLAGAVGAAQPESDSSRKGEDISDKHMKELIRETLLQYPEILQEAQKTLSKRKIQKRRRYQANLITEHYQALYADPLAPVLGNHEAPHTIIGFVDYQCSACNYALKELEKYVNEHKDVRLLLKDLSIFGESSLLAAKGALIAQQQGKYLPYHTLMLSHEGELTEEVVRKIAKEVGVDLKNKKHEEQADLKLAENHSLFEKFALQATPTFIVGDGLYTGFKNAKSFDRLVTKKLRKALEQKAEMAKPPLDQADKLPEDKES